MKLVEQEKKKKTATKAKCCVILCLPFKGGAFEVIFVDRGCAAHAWDLQYSNIL